MKGDDIAGRLLRFADRKGTAWVVLVRIRICIRILLADRAADHVCFH